jgi:hypothetical protein
MRKFIGIALVLTLVLSIGTCFAASPEKKAERAAKDWLELIDGKNYAESYDEAASFFRAMVDKKDWIKTLRNLRSMLGEAVSRKLISAKRANKMAGAPDGEYVIITYKTKFDKKADAREVIVPMLDKDGKWRISGYHIQ